MTDFDTLAALFAGASALAVLGGCTTFAFWRSSAKWRRGAAKHRARAEAYANAAEADAAMIRYLRNRLFRAGAMTPAQASAFASEMGKRGRAKQLGRLAA